MQRTQKLIPELPPLTPAQQPLSELELLRINHSLRIKIAQLEEVIGRMKAAISTMGAPLRPSQPRRKR